MLLCSYSQKHQHYLSPPQTAIKTTIPLVPHESVHCGLCVGDLGDSGMCHSLDPVPRLITNSIRSSSITIPLSPTISPSTLFPWTLQELQ